jgi:dTMP kinase
MFVTFEGIEGTGKSTQIGLLAKALSASGLRVAVTLEPGGSLIGRELRRILLSLETKNLCDRAELFLYLADRAQHVAEVVRPALDEGMVVLCDRFADSTVAYQGYGRGLDPALLGRLNDTATGSLVPDLTILLTSIRKPACAGPCHETCATGPMSRKGASRPKAWPSIHGCARAT